MVYKYFNGLAFQYRIVHGSIFQCTHLALKINNYIVKSYRVVIVITKFVTSRASKACIKTKSILKI